jgi:hypothetical protein
MLEQSVSSHDWISKKQWRIRFRILQIILLVFFILGEVLGISLAFVYFETNQALFWQRVLIFLVLGLPMLIVTLLLQISIRRRSIQYDYEIRDNTFTVYRIIGSQRMKYLSFGLDTVTEVIRLADNMDEKKVGNALKSSVFACCNPDDSRLTLVWTNGCVMKNNYSSTSVLLELNNPLFERLIKATRKK